MWTKAMELDLPALSRILAGALLGYLSRWIQEMLARKRRAVESDLDLLERWLGYLTGSMKALEWMIDDFVQDQLQIAGRPGATPEAEEVRKAYMDMYIRERTEMEKLAPKVASIHSRYPELSDDMLGLDHVYKQVHDGFVLPLTGYLAFVAELPESASKDEIERGLEPHKRAITDGVKLAKLCFGIVWPQLATLHAKVRRLR